MEGSRVEFEHQKRNACRASSHHRVPHQVVSPLVEYLTESPGNVFREISGEGLDNSIKKKRISRAQFGSFTRANQENLVPFESSSSLVAQIKPLEGDLTGNKVEKERSVRVLVLLMALRMLVESGRIPPIHLLLQMQSKLSMRHADKLQQSGAPSHCIQLTALTYVIVFKKREFLSTKNSFLPHTKALSHKNSSYQIKDPTILDPCLDNNKKIEWWCVATGSCSFVSLGRRSGVHEFVKWKKTVLKRVFKRRVHVRELYFVFLDALINKFLKRAGADNAPTQRPTMRDLVIELIGRVRQAWPKTSKLLLAELSVKYVILQVMCLISSHVIKLLTCYLHLICGILLAQKSVLVIVDECIGLTPDVLTFSCNMFQGYHVLCSGNKKYFKPAY
ncbi:uncharacterized protein LOC120067652 [Benincasa hispida]|uniref:uncharacterized protein LOC120067652 n=1 Tax=Benincasa hispida TaxID=102211 RepID=UPI0019012F43|nr:uncharacterized protein LOC120067652 [Benincasa hispida]